MSTILKALKKIEKETNGDLGKPGSPHPTIKTSPTINRRLTTLWYLQLGKRFLWIGSGIAVACLCIYTAMNLFRTDPPVKQSQAQKSDIQNTVPRKAPEDLALNNSDNSEPTAEQHGPTRPQAYAPKHTYDPNHRPGHYARKFGETSPSSENISTPGNKREAPLETEVVSPQGMNKDEIGNGQDLYPEEDSYQAADTDAQQAEIEILDDDPEELRYAQVDMLESGSLTLQAISYSKTPSERIAVVNNEIMHQGQFVSGYKIVYIGPEQVVVEQKGQQWKIVFMVR